MKKITTLFVITLIICATNTFGQARREVNFGLIGASYEIPVHTDITIAPAAGTNLEIDWFTIGVKGNYYFDNLFEITNDAWDVYGGAGIGYAFRIGDEFDNDGNKYDDDLDIGLHVGGRWFWNDRWGLYLEIGGGNTQGAAGGLGITMKL